MDPITNTERMLVLRLLREHDGEWGWYQLERALANTRSAGTNTVRICEALLAEGLITADGDPRLAKTRYTLTSAGIDALPQG